MKRFTLLLAAFALLAPGVAGADGIRIPLPPVPIIVPDPPLFLVPPQLDFKVAVDSPYDLFLIDNRYYVFKDRSWYVGPAYGGPWKPILFERLPTSLRKHKLHFIRGERDREYHRYRQDRHYDRSRAYRPERHHGEDRDKTVKPQSKGKHTKHGNKEKHRGKGKGGDD